MNNVITSFASGDLHTNLLKIALPRFYEYGLKHNFDLFVPSINQVVKICKNQNWTYSRPASWLKIPILKHLLLLGYDNVVWLDCDIYINNTAHNILDYVQNNDTQSFAIHLDKYEGNVPNMGVWILNQKSLQLLDEIWNNSEFINHKWWEQGSNINIIQNNPEYLNSFSVLPYDFNVHKNDIRYNQNYEKDGYFLHATCWSDRLEKMKEWSNNVY